MEFPGNSHVHRSWQADFPSSADYAIIADAQHIVHSEQISPTCSTHRLSVNLS
jgi:hypothetical protein